ncbi:hypothetical protein, partial [Leptospira noumeaensis]|uniref:hypothetical protein n=1 Tax=Leptospira noumeaensis TaxID=2484964 RepID=UPI001ABF2A3D
SITVSPSLGMYTTSQSSIVKIVQGNSFFFSIWYLKFRTKDRETYSERASSTCGYFIKRTLFLPRYRQEQK